ncbi:MAG: sensor histidine kinase [Planctomycetota bacterium]
MWSLNASESRALAWFCAYAAAFVAGTGSFACAAYAAAPEKVTLAGPLRVSIDDRPEYAEEHFDDTHWLEATLPGTWPAPRERGGFQALWGRFRFELPKGAPVDRRGIRLGIIYRNDEVYLNGQLLGNTGEIGWGKPLLDPTIRVYAVPDGLLRAGDKNTLAIRVQRSVGEAIEVVGPVVIGSYEKLLRDAQPEDRLFRVVRGLDLGISAVFVLASLVLWLLVRQKDVLALFVSEVLLFCSPLNLTLANLYDGHGEWIALANLVFGVTAGVLSTVALLVYVVLLFRQPLPLWCWLCAAPCVSVLTIRWIMPASIVGPTTSLGVFLTMASRASSMAVLVLMTVVVGIAVVRRNAGALPIATGLAMVIWLAAQYPLDTPSLSPAGLWRWFLPLSMMWVFRFSMLLGAVSSYHSVQKSVTRLSTRVLSAQEQERERLSRELHDGVAQALHATRLEARRLSSKASNQAPELAGLADSLANWLGQAADELRDVSHDLQPKFLFDRTLGDSLRWYAEQLASRVGLKTEVETPDSRDLPDGMKPHVYRIVQEALTNAVRHGEASNAWVTLRALPGGWGLRVEDDGRGFEPEATPAAGHGLNNIRDRAELLGGRSRIMRRDPSGVVVEVDLPAAS